MSKNLIAAIVAALGLFLFFVVALPQYDMISLSKAAIASRHDLLSSRQMELANLQALAKQYQARQSDISKMVVFLPQTKQNDQIVSSIQAATQQSGLQLINLTVAQTSQASQTATNYRTTAISLDASGSYTSLVSLLKALEQNLRLYDITDIQVTKPNTTGSNLDMTIKLNAYNLK